MRVPVVAPRLSPEALSAWLCGFQAVFRAYGYERMIVGGSGARALLDGDVAALRDVDVFLDGDARLVSGLDACAELVRIAADLADVGVIRGAPGAPREKRRADPGLSPPARDRHTIGAGLHVFPCAPPLPIVSLTVLTCPRGLALNGIFDIDAVYLLLDTRRPLLAQMGAPTVLDPFMGYAAWRARRPRVVHWEEVARCHARHGLRIARTLAACGRRELDAALLERYRMHRPAGPVDAPDEVYRDLLKLLAGPQWSAGLALARQLGGFTDDPAFAWLVTALAAWAPAQAHTDEGRGPDTALARARRWLAALGDDAQEPLARLTAAVPGVFAFA